ncbi:response regulator transcription factor [uncultured Albimonas sp.]|uniref:response regulator transcription factor n=1 Tax=uncultured Albimonas sp. TaxID=1331701 RepID=UPI0030EC3D6B|tara:strand:- start:317 stop:958 length:642 start_codon:yes stop_codon:yes gene_type:complete
MTTRPVVHVLDDDEAVRLAIASLLQSVGLESRTHGSTQAFLEAERPDVESCLVLDVRLPGTSGLDLQELLAERGVELPVILVTGHGDIPMSVRGMKAGAVDFLSKPFREQDLLDAVARALAIDRARRAERHGLEALRARYATLSPRERQVMARVAAGLLNKQVAGELGISEITVKIHRGAAMRKMDARTLPDLVRMQDAIAAAPARPADDTLV